MTLYDSSVLIDYLDRDATAVEYVEEHVDERAVTTPLAMW
jgi:predicted nucleic acid-binding protein